MTQGQDWRRLGRAVKARRDDLRLTQGEVVTRGGPSLPTIQSIEAARSDAYAGRTLAKLEDALGWTRGSAEAVLLGGEPTTVEPRTADSGVVAAVLADPNLLPEAKQHLVNQYGLLLRVQAASRVPAQPMTDDEADFVATGQADLDATGSLHLVDDDRNCQ